MNILMRLPMKNLYNVTAKDNFKFGLLEMKGIKVVNDIKLTKLK